MNKFFIQASNNGGYIEVEEPVFVELVGLSPYSEYANKLYRGSIAITDVPEEYRETVQTVVDNKVARWGKYEDQAVPLHELRTMAENLPQNSLTRATAKALFADIEKLRTGATDAVASAAVSVYPQLKEDGSLIKAGTRINWNGILKRAAVDLWDTADNNPDNAPTLWEDISYLDGYRIIPETITVGTAFALDECGWWGDVLYKSLMASNVYTPDQYPAGWKVVE